MTESNEQTIERVYCVVAGRVQGVGFRAFVVSEARLLGLTGWVRNGNDGRTVEIVAEGLHDPIRRFFRAVNTGPRSSSVTDVRESVLEGSQEFAEFSIRH